VFVIAEQPAASRGERAVMTDASEYIQQLTLAGMSTSGPAGGEKRQMQAGSQANGCLIPRFFGTIEMALHFHVNVARPKEVEELLERATGFVVSAAGQGGSEQTFFAAGEADQSFRVRRKFFPGGCAFTFRALAQLVACDQTAEVLVSNAGLGQQSDPHRTLRNLMRPPGWRADLIAGAGQGDFRSDVCAHAQLFCRQVKAWRTIDTVAIKQCYGRHSEFGTACGQRFRQSSAFQKTERRAGMKFDVHQS
jgi:hypothetical protein